MNDGRMPDTFDRLMASLHGLPDVVTCKATPVRTLVPLLGNSQTYIVQTYRQREAGDSIFLEYVSGESSCLRLVIPPKVADVIARQREALTTMARRRAGKAAAADRKARGELPGFLKQKKG